MSSKDSKVTMQKSGSFDDHVSIDAVVGGVNGATMFSLLSPDTKAKPSKEVVSDDVSSSTHQKWGDNDDEPKKWRAKLEKSTTALPLIAKQVAMMYGMGFVYYREVREGDSISYDFTPIPEIDNFIQANEINTFLMERMMDYRFNNNLWCEYLVSNDEKKITNIYHLESEFCRFGPTEENKFKEVYYKGDYSKSGDPEKIPFISKRELNSDTIGKQAKFCTHNSFPMPGRTIYSVPPHIGLYRDLGWLDYANSIPEIMNSVNKNVMDLKYHIRIPYEYWPRIHSNWTELSQQKKDEFIKKKLTEMNDWLTGTKNAGKAFISHFATDEITGKPLAGWEIIEMNENGKKDKYLTSVQEADIQTTRSLQMDVSLAGIQPAGGKMGAGSGSDKRTAFVNQISVSFSDIEVITYPLRVVQAFNGWDPSVKWSFMHVIPTTLNENKSGSKTSLDGIQ